MKIALCGSFAHIKDIMVIKKGLEDMGHQVFIPHNAQLYADGLLPPETREESTKNKIEGDLIRYYYGVIKNSDAILAVNKDKHNIKNYIGGNTFIEIAFAHILDKRIFLLNPVPNMPYSDEILAIKHTVINNDLSKIN